MYLNVNCFVYHALEIALIREQNIDITTFEADLDIFKTGFAKNYTSKTWQEKNSHNFSAITGYNLLCLTQIIFLCVYPHIHTHACVCVLILIENIIHFIVQSLSSVQFFLTPWTAACQASLSSPSPGVCSNSCPLSQ